MPKGRGLTSCADDPPLPPGGGPQLNVFSKDPGDTIKWIKRLDEDREDNDGFVFQVGIGSKEYALKVFKFSHPRLNRFYQDLCLEHPLPLKDGIRYTDPFYADLVKEQTAVKCYGYLLLNMNDSRWLRKEGIDSDQQLLDRELHESLGGDTRVRAIVKQFERKPIKVHAGNIRRAWRNVYLLNDSLKLYKMDIKADNFIGYKLVDFGTSWTEPHILLDCLEEAREKMAKVFKLKDRVNFEGMIEEEDIKTRLQVLARSEHQLRSKGKPEWADRGLPKRRRIDSK
ncbi:kinetochore Sim4 complex subunit FTA2-domain-containing protein [Xylaria digitata]|nr:kinetochore Sim4 complex subunit FTA2-domain-containing protein [Xylaria digitata]